MADNKQSLTPEEQELQKMLEANNPWAKLMSEAAVLQTLFHHPAWSKVLLPYLESIRNNELTNMIYGEHNPLTALNDAKHKGMIQVCDELLTMELRVKTALANKGGR